MLHVCIVGPFIHYVITNAKQKHPGCKKSVRPSDKASNTCENMLYSIY